MTATIAFAPAALNEIERYAARHGFADCLTVSGEQRDGEKWFSATLRLPGQTLVFRSDDLMLAILGVVARASGALATVAAEGV